MTDTSLTGSLLGGRYRLEAPIGRGGMGEVYRATDERVGREVAVKLFRPGAGDGEGHRWGREVSTLARLTHPNLVTLYDAGEDQERVYLVMQLVEGDSLAALCVDRSLDPDKVAAVGTSLAEALAYIHEAGVVHRDVKPANVLVDGTGRAYLADFGVVRLVDGSRLTATGLLIGTASYVAPEQVRGEEAGPAADVYALGLVLLECLTGVREYEGAPLTVATQRLSRPPNIPDWLTPDWAALLRDMTASEPEQRPSADDVALRLTRLGTADPTSRSDAESSPTRHLTRPTPVTEPARMAGRTRTIRSQWSRAGEQLAEVKGRRLYAVLAAGLAALVILILIALPGGKPADQPRPDEAGAPGKPAGRPLPPQIQQDFRELKKAVTP